MMVHSEVKKALEERVAELMRAGHLFGTATVMARREIGWVTPEWRKTS